MQGITFVRPQRNTLPERCHQSVSCPDLSHSFTININQPHLTAVLAAKKGCMLQLFQARLSQASVFGIQSQLKGFGAHDDRSIPSTKANRKKCLGRWRIDGGRLSRSGVFRHFKGTGSICISYRSFVNMCRVYDMYVCVHMYLLIDLYLFCYSSILHRSVHNTVLCPTMPVLCELLPSYPRHCFKQISRRAFQDAWQQLRDEHPHLAIS